MFAYLPRLFQGWVTQTDFPPGESCEQRMKVFSQVEEAAGSLRSSSEQRGASHNATAVFSSELRGRHLLSYAVSPLLSTRSADIHISRPRSVLPALRDARRAVELRFPYYGRPWPCRTPAPQKEGQGEKCQTADYLGNFPSFFPSVHFAPTLFSHGSTPFNSIPELWMTQARRQLVCCSASASSEACRAMPGPSPEPSHTRHWLFGIP